MLPALAASASGQTTAPVLPTKIYGNASIPYQGDEGKKGRQFFHGSTHGQFALEMHETILGPSVQTHEPHKHEHEEIVIVVEGTVETWVEGKTEVAAAGSVIYFGSNQMHSARNVGASRCRYYVVELRGHEG